MDVQTYIARVGSWRSCGQAEVERGANQKRGRAAKSGRSPDRRENMNESYMMQAESHREFLQVGYSRTFDGGSYDVRHAYLMHGQRTWLSPAMRKTLDAALRLRRAS